MKSPSDSGEHGFDPSAVSPPDEVVTLSRIEFDQLKALAAASEKSARQSGLMRPYEDAFVKELSERDQTISGLRSSVKEAVRDRELATALAEKSVVANSVGQLIKLLRDDLEVYEELGEYKVTSRDGRSVAEWVSERLASAAYSHFCLPSSRGGVAAKGPTQPSPRESPSYAARTLGEFVISQWRASAEPSARPGGWVGRK